MQVNLEENEVRCLCAAARVLIKSDDCVNEAFVWKVLNKLKRSLGDTQ